MKTFHFRADCKFEAMDIDDAFRRLAEHFERLGSDDEDRESDFLNWGTMEISWGSREGLPKRMTW